jgi:prepilin-type N-terminal cleavage/methylation domain-containing protein
MTMIKRIRRIFRTERGVTLAEILVATSIISIGLVGLAVVIPMASYGVHEGNALSTATFLAEQRLEEIRNASWTTTPSSNDCLGTGPTAAPTSSTCTRTQPTSCTSGTSCTTWADEAAVTGYTGYSRNVRITDCGTTACAGVNNANLRLVRVTVSYTPISGVGGAAAGASKSAVLELLVAKRE